MKTIPLTGKYANGAVCLVDDDIFEAIKERKWRVDEKGYVVRASWKDGKAIKIVLHRWIMGNPPGRLVDHRDGNKLDCRRSNLRLADTYQNSANCAPKRADGLKGITWDKANTSWRAVIQYQHQR